MTLADRYTEAKLGPTPGVAFIREVAEVTKKSEITVRRWLAGVVMPDTLTQEVLAKHFKTTPAELFPQK